MAKIAAGSARASAAPKRAARPAAKAAAKPAAKAKAKSTPAATAKAAPKAASSSASTAKPAVAIAASLIASTDGNGDGSVKIADEAVRSLGTTKAGVEAQIDRTALLKAADRSGDGTVTKAEMTSLVRKHDTDGDGRLSGRENARLRAQLRTAVTRVRIEADGTRTKSERGFFKDGDQWYYRNEWGSTAKADNPPKYKVVIDKPKACGCAPGACAHDGAGAAKPVTAPPTGGVTQKPGGVFDGRGIFVANVDGFSVDQARAAVAAGFTWIAAQGANHHEDGTPVKRDDLDPAWIAQMREAGLKVGVWNVLGSQPARDAQIAAELIAAHDLDFFIADAERWHKADEGGSRENSQQFVQEFRRLQPHTALALSTYAAAHAPNLLGSVNQRDAGPMDFKAWNDAGAVYMPQVYPGEFGPVYSLANTIDHARRGGWDMSRVKPTLGFYRGEIPETYSDLPSYGTQGFSVYLGENITDASYWARLAALEVAGK